MGTFGRGQVYGEVADEYDGLRPGYPEALVAAVFGYAGPVGRMVEVGAGTGKATTGFAARGAPIQCIEPDPRMAAVLRDRMAGHPQVEVEVTRFEDWQPPAGGVDLLYSAQAWHWVDRETRWLRAHAALAPGGTVAIFAHSFNVVDPAVEAEVRPLHDRLRPGSSVVALPAVVDPEQTWFAVELTGSGLFTDARTSVFRRSVSYPTSQFLALARTFSAYRALPPAQRQEMHDTLERIIDGHGGAIEIELATVLALGRRGRDRLGPAETDVP